MTTNDGVTAGLACTVAGSGERGSMVLAHANGGDHRDFDAVTPALVADGWRVTAIDWPGHGTSPRRPPERAVDFGPLLIEVLEQTPGAPHVVLGNSVGGFAALWAAAHRPDLVRSLVLVAPGGFTPRWPGTSIACRLLGTETASRRAIRLLPHLYLRERNEQVAELLTRADAAASDPERVAVHASLWRSFTDPGHDGRALASRVTCPTLVAWGRRDPILVAALDGRRARRSMPHASYVSFACGHQPFAELPDEFLAALRAFLDPAPTIGGAEGATEVVDLAVERS